MENERLIYKIKSKYILMHLLNYIPDKNIQFKLFIHSKLYQNKLNINLVYYKQNYLKRIENDIKLFFYQRHDAKDTLEEKYNKYLLDKKLNKEELESDIFSIKNEEKDKIIKENFETKININSPLFEIISKRKKFENNYTIYISQKDIDEYKLKEKYKNIFNDLNTSDVKYSSIYYYFEDKNKINYLKELNINFDKIKRMTFIYNRDLFKYKDKIEADSDNINKENKYFFETLFSINNIINNLIYLKLDIRSHLDIDPDLFENINTFKSLEYLFISNIKFKKKFTIKLQNLKTLKCQFCKNIFFSKNNNFKELNLYNNEISDIKILKNVKFEKLEILNLSWNKIPSVIISQYFDFKELKELYLFYNEISCIKILQGFKLEKIELLDLHCNRISNINIFRNVNMNELKKLDLSLNNISDLKALLNIELEKLEFLDLRRNNISNINILKYANFKELKHLDLSENKISDINDLDKVEFEKLEILNLRSNRIKDINNLENVNFKELKRLDLSKNILSDIKILEKVNFQKLEILNLSSECISDISILENVNFKELKELYLYNNKISDINVLGIVNFEKLKILNLSTNQIANIK